VANGHRVISLGRRATGGEHRAYSLETPSEDGLLDEVEIVIHCAWDLTITDVGAIESVNVQGTERLVKDAEHSHARVVFISSMSAYDGTKQIYGRAKLRCERVVLERGGEAVRLGLVWGGDEGGMIATLRRLSRLPVLPLLGPDLRQFTVHADDVGAGLLKLVERPCSEPLGLAHPVPVPFELIMSELRGGGRPRMVRVPWAPVYGALIAGERLGIPLPVRADSLLGLVRPAPEVPGVAYWSEVGLRLRPFPGVRA
jgi:nucleoside-diphosphate-sugar epimerase